MAEPQSLGAGARVRHAQWGEGTVVFAKAGFPKVKVQFRSGEQKVDASELTVLQAAVAGTPEGELGSLVTRLRDVFRNYGRGEPGSRTGMHYDLAEVELIFRVRHNPENSSVLAQVLGRKPDAIAYVWRWCEQANFPPEADNEIVRHVQTVAERLGGAKRGTWLFVPPEILRLRGS